MRNNVNFSLQVNKETKNFRVLQMPPKKAIRLQLIIQKDIVPALFSHTDSLVLSRELLQCLDPSVIDIVLDTAVFSEEVSQVIDGKAVPLDENTFNSLFGGDLMATWEFIYKVLEANYKDFIVALPGKLQELFQKLPSMGKIPFNI